MMTEKQRELARHALGLTDGRTVSYRNRYVAALHSFHEMAWDDLVRDGLAERGRNGKTSVGFCLTDPGARLALKPDETLDPEDFPSAVGHPQVTGGDNG